MVEGRTLGLTKDERIEIKMKESILKTFDAEFTNTKLDIPEILANLVMNDAKKLAEGLGISEENAEKRSEVLKQISKDTDVVKGAKLIDDISKQLGWEPVKL